MSRKSRWGRWFSWVYAAVVLTASSWWVVQAQQAPNPNFTGTVKTVEENSKGQIAHFRFEAGSRTKWHSHSGGQIILVEEGVGLYQEKGGPVMELRAGETRYCPPGVVHWHGAAPDQGGTQFNVSRGDITWLDAVTDQEFNAPHKHK
jgi:quercetin dioxygenase-like cupin family protein